MPWEKQCQVLVSKRDCLFFFEISDILETPSESSSHTVIERLVDAEIFSKSIFGQKASVEMRRLNQENLNAVQNLEMSIMPRPPSFTGSLQSSRFTSSDFLFHIN